MTAIDSDTYLRDQIGSVDPFQRHMPAPTAANLLARVLAFVQTHDHPEARIDIMLPGGPAVVWSTFWVDTANASGCDPSLARTMSEARYELGY